jgi:hypothetical protein
MLWVLFVLFLMLRTLDAENIALAGDNRHIEAMGDQKPACFDADDWVMAGLVRYLHAPAMVSACDHP